MKRSRRVVLTMMGSAAAGAVSMGLVSQNSCGAGSQAIPGPDQQPWCRPVHGGFGGTPQHMHGHSGHAHGGG